MDDPWKLGVYNSQLRRLFIRKQDVSCDFSEDQCGWTNDPDNEIDWKYNGESLASTDHTVNEMLARYKHVISIV